MLDRPDAGVMPGIVALPPTTARQIGSGQVLVDPSSIVKELIDNALDGRAKSIFVDITANTIDTIQVKDDGHGIPAEDRALVCRRYCTSKIRDFHDLKEVGGQWLGFRGEALSSMAEMSGTLSVTTRVEGEPVAVKLKYGRNGELASTERDSHPIGTTVKVTNFFEHIPVRKQTALKSSTKWLGKIRRLIQAYALARPAVRYRLHILKAKNEKGDFVYAPKADADIKDIISKVIGKDCALQCDWTAMETDGFEIRAILPKPTAHGSKIANHGAFVSIDARPMSNSRRTVKQVVAVVKDRLRKSNSSLGAVKDPFFCMNIICPPDSYDPNIEPAKDDVMFENRDLIMGAIDKLLSSYYPIIITETEDIEPPTSAQRPQEFELDERPLRDQTPVSVYEDAFTGLGEENMSKSPQDQPRWRSSMYGIDEDDLEFLQENRPLVIEEEEGLRAATVSNPWTIALMNAAINPKKLTANRQLLSPAKSQRASTPMPSSPTSAITPYRNMPSEPLTPQTSSRSNMLRSSLDNELEKSIQHLPRPSSEGHPERDRREHGPGFRDEELSNISPSKSRDPTCSTQVNFERPGIQPSETNQFSSTLQDTSPIPLSAPRRNQRKQQALDDTWFGQPMRGSEPSQPSHHQKRAKHRDVPRPVMAATERLIEDRPYSKNNTDIRSFLRRNMRPQRRASDDRSPAPRFPRIGFQLKSSQFTGELSLVNGCGDRPSPPSSQRGTPFHGSSRATSAEPQPRSKHFRDQLLFHSDRGTTRESAKKTHRLRRYTTDGLERTKSSKLPLERVPHGYRIQDVVLPLAPSLVAVVQSARKLDMSRNSLEWGYSLDQAFDAFAERNTERKIMDWVIKIDEMLHEQHERMDRVDTRCELHEGIQRGLDARKEQDGGNDTIEDIIHNWGPVPAENVLEDMSDFSMSQLVDLDADVHVATMGVVEDKSPIKVADDFDDDIDDMLMDL
ncbi:uncharacterized protein K460DRAFT_349578 [Cucurbitaria berberidis CBS 394.84]|uniref:DNA mismatch repair protein S5 domain-containing protein n=1 Tax=Cucurbitaria berberidis CBS 394.84 TaxID=1168544 RepID=A0A9P4G781_9PLEO|nr:uncharacterized protein K460DRAFT_349578 [Cucurbitaria berberidis CBS 394.84]KAF1839995.1 hypothetical protein K460DRAFT_349578 [Cucurbitaria berberidis CBS 394.84]